MKENRKFNYGWVIVAFGALVMSTLHYTCFNSFGLFVMPVTEGLGISRAALSLTMTIGSVASVILAPVAGNLLAHKSVKKYMFFGILISGLCIFGEGFATSVYQLYFLTLVLQAASTFALALPFSILMLRWFDENRAFATSIIFVGVSLGGVLFASPLTSLIMAHGWRTAYMVIGLAIICVDAPLCLLIVRNYPRERNKSFTVENAGDEAAEAKKENGLGTTGDAITERMTIENGTSGSTEKAEPENALLTSGVYREPRFWLLVAGLFCNSFACVALYHIPAFIQSLGYTAELAAKMVSFYSFINIFAKITMGVLFDRFGMKSGVFFGAFGTVGCYLFMIFAAIAPGGVLLLLFSFLFGIGLATQSMFVPSLVGGLYGEKQYSIIYGRVSVFTLLAGGISNPVISMVFDHTGSYLTAWILCLAISVLCGICLLAACRKRS